MSHYSEINVLHDKKSQMILQQHRDMLNAGVYVSFFAHINGNMNRFEHYGLPLSEHEVIFTINPMQGGAIKQLSHLTNNTCQIHYFEENSLLYMDVCKNIIAWQLEEIVKPVCAGITEKSAMYAIQHNGGSGHYTSGELMAINDMAREEITQAVYCYSLDEYVEHSGVKPTLIECGRPNTAKKLIDGGQETITANRPNLMLVDSPFSTLPEQLKKLVPEYRIFYCEYGLRGMGVYYATVSNVTGYQDLTERANA